MALNSLANELENCIKIKRTKVVMRHTCMKIESKRNKKMQIQWLMVGEDIKSFGWSNRHITERRVDHYAPHKTSNGE